LQFDTAIIRTASTTEAAAEAAAETARNRSGLTETARIQTSDWRI